MDTRAEPPAKPAAPAAGRASLRAFFLRFALAFAVLEALVYLVLWHPAWFAPYAEVNARIAAAMLSPFVEVRAVDSYLVSSGFSINVRPGCDGYQASAVLLAGIFAFPAARSRKWIGAALGVGALLALNLLRLAALLWTGLHHGERFEAMHLQILPAAITAAALVLLLSWAHWARR